MSKSIYIYMGSGGRAVERRTVNRVDGGSLVRVYTVFSFFVFKFANEKRITNSFSFFAFKFANEKRKTNSFFGFVFKSEERKTKNEFVFRFCI